LEDTNVTETEIAQGFGENVLNLVLSVSEKRESKSPSSSDWKERKLHTIQYLKECEEEGTIAIAIADKMDNAISIAKDKIVVGEKIWEKFRAPFLDQKWYYSQLSQTFQAKKNNWGNSIQLLSDQFTDVVHSVFGIY
jgi:myo-inositol-1(or 4)-monophosphatase